MRDYSAPARLERLQRDLLDGIVRGGRGALIDDDPLLGVPLVLGKGDARAPDMVALLQGTSTERN